MIMTRDQRKELDNMLRALRSGYRSFDHLAKRDFPVTAAEKKATALLSRTYKRRQKIAAAYSKKYFALLEAAKIAIHFGDDNAKALAALKKVREFRS